MLINKSKFLYVGAILVLTALLAAKASAEPSAGAPAAVDSAGLCSAVTGALAGTAAAAATDGDQAAELKPTNPVHKSCADGKVRMVVGITPMDAEGNPASHRHFGHTIMDKIPLTVVLDLDATVMVDFSSLVQQGVIGFAGSDFTLYKPEPGEPPAVSISGPTIRGERRIYVINLIAQTAVFKQSVVFNLDLRYATAMLPDGKAPKWLAMTTPDFPVSKMTVVDNGTELMEGDLSQRAERLPWAANSALVLGAILMLLHAGVKLVKWLSRIRPRRQIAPNRLAWMIFDANYKDGSNSGFRVKHLVACSHALRSYLASLPQYPQIDALTISEIGTHFPEADTKELATIIRVITVFENEIFSSGSAGDEATVTLEEAELEQLFTDIESLVPRTWDSRE
ncbi:MAG: hypothetical protein JST01_00575 [Cyanobacteria bacterium SZAS TMP-1]|nr:hypothetical protein [Cyanobacteria bacterium SZAS TMP-1]